METYLLQFKLGHFLTFDGIQTFSMVAGPSENHPDHIIETPSQRVLKISFIYGANSSGKSNFIKGFMYSRMKVVGSRDDHYDYGIDRLRDYTHIDPSGKRSTEPSYFEYVVMADGRLFSFGFEVDTRSGTMMSEWLVEIFNDGSEETLYAIDLEGNYSGDDVFKGYFGEYAGGRHTDTFIDHMRRSNYSGEYSGIVQGLIDWFVFGLKVVPSSLTDCLIPVDGTYVKRLERELQSLDVQVEVNVARDNDVIHGLKKATSLVHPLLSFDPSKVLRGRAFVNLPQSFNLFDESCGFLPYQTLSFFHLKGEMKLKYEQESEGTRKIIFLLTLLMSKMDGISNTVVFDEMESNLHTLVCKEIVKRVVGNNYSCDQMIVSTHETRLMEGARSDEVWVLTTSTGRDEGCPTLHSVQEYKDADEETLEVDYLGGLYGGTPEIRWD